VKSGLTFACKSLTLLGALSLTTGWSADDMIASQQKPSASIKQQLIAVSKDYFVDPYSVRDAEISAVVTYDPKKNIQAVCIRANAKNRMGAYAGKISFSVRMSRGQTLNVNTQARGCQLKGLRYYPFLELEALQ
jgi:hypothetical protein